MTNTDSGIQYDMSKNEIKVAPNDGSYMLDGYELVCGLEVHVELATATKLFSASANRFGDEPNTHIDPVTLGLPGALPVLNRQAVELAMRIGLALNCSVQPSTFHRKNYFYPDMPRPIKFRSTTNRSTLMVGLNCQAVSASELSALTSKKTRARAPILVEPADVFMAATTH